MINLLAVLLVLLARRKKIDLYIGFGFLITLLGLFMKKLGYVKNVLYYDQDYFPYPSKPTLFGRVYWHLWNLLDRICLRKSTLVWYLSKGILLQRVKDGTIAEHDPRNVVVPHGTTASLMRFDISNRNLLAICFVGTLIKEKGVDLAIQAMPELLRIIPNICLRVIGSGPQEAELRNLANKLGVRDHVEFLGFIDLTERPKPVAECAIGLALYPPGSFSRFTEPSKLKVYLSFGLPIIVTHGPEFAEDIKRFKLGKVINFNREELIQALCSMLQNPDALEGYYERIQDFNSKNSWTSILSKALNRSEQLLSS
jgi:glycosyltransferase involved in cell wall biosynthesis